MKKVDLGIHSLDNRFVVEFNSHIGQIIFDIGIHEEEPTIFLYISLQTGHTTFVRLKYAEAGGVGNGKSVQYDHRDRSCRSTGGLNIYLLMEPKEQHKIKREAGEAICEMKKSGAEADGIRLTVQGEKEQSMGIKDQMRKKRKKQELLDDLPDYEVLGLADDEIDLQPALDLLAQEKSGRIEENLWAIFLI